MRKHWRESQGSKVLQGQCCEEHGKTQIKFCIQKRKKNSIDGLKVIILYLDQVSLEEKCKLGNPILLKTLKIFHQKLKNSILRVV